MSIYTTFPRHRMVIPGTRELTTRCRNRIRELAEILKQGEDVPRGAAEFLVDIIDRLEDQPNGDV